MAQDISIKLVPANSNPTVASSKANSFQRVLSAYDFQVNWTRGSWAGTTSSGWFSYSDSDSTDQPALQTFELTLGGPEPIVVCDGSSGESLLYWDGTRITVRESLGLPDFVLLYPISDFSGDDQTGYYVSFAETASGRLLNVHSSYSYQYLGGGLLTYKKRESKLVQTVPVSTPQMPSDNLLSRSFNWLWHKTKHIA